MNLHDALATAIALHELTDDPQLAAAIKILSQRISDKDAQLSRVEQKAVRLVAAMDDAYLTLFGHRVKRAR